MSEEHFHIKTESFEGPLDLLLSLIEKRKLFINDISLSQVADDFIAFIQSKEDFPTDQTAHFILVASTLLLIKSKSLLPDLTLTEEESSNIEDLERRLKLYQMVKATSQKLAPMFGKNMIFSKTPSKEMHIVFTPHESMTTLAMLQSMHNVLQSLPKKEVLPQTIVKKIMSLEEMIDTLTTRIQSGLKMNFSDFAKGHASTQSTGARHTVSREEKVMVIVSFLAMLELVKQGVIEVKQESHIDDISIETESLNIPNYS